MGNYICPNIIFVFTAIILILVQYGQSDGRWYAFINFAEDLEYIFFFFKKPYPQAIRVVPSIIFLKSNLDTRDHPYVIFARL